MLATTIGTTAKVAADMFNFSEFSKAAFDRGVDTCEKECSLFRIE